MRNRVVHDYGNVDFEIVWETVQTHLPLLFKELGSSEEFVGKWGMSDRSLPVRPGGLIALAEGDGSANEWSQRSCAWPSDPK